MKAITDYFVFMVFWALMGAITVTAANAETVIIDDKEFQMVEIDSELLVSKQWEPAVESGYTDEYLASEQYQTIKQANESLRRIRGEL